MRFIIYFCNQKFKLVSISISFLLKYEQFIYDFLIKNYCTHKIEQTK